MKFKIDRQIISDYPNSRVIFRLLDWFNLMYPESQWITDHDMQNPSFKSGDGAWHIDMICYKNVVTGHSHILCNIDIQDEELAVMFTMIKDQFE